MPLNVALYSGQTIKTACSLFQIHKSRIKCYVYLHIMYNSWYVQTMKCTFAFFFNWKTLRKRLNQK